MSISVRCYIFAPDGLQRISQRVMDGLCHGKDAMPQFADTKQKIANAIIELADGKPTRVLEIEGTFLEFDQLGKVHEYLRMGFVQAMETFAALERSERLEPSTVIDIAPKLNRAKWERDNRWNPSGEDIDLIEADSFDRSPVTEVKHAKGTADKPPPLTFEAKSAIEEIQTHFFGIQGHIDALSEQALKGFAFDARRRAKDDLDNPLWLGIADAADRRREILARYRTGKGVWYASVDIIRWETSRLTGRTDSLVHERCNSKKEAEEAARRLLVENAKYFSAETAVEARVVCDLEWQDDRTDDDA
jgi:hypothetical protein